MPPYLGKFLSWPGQAAGHGGNADRTPLPGRTPTSMSVTHTGMRDHTGHVTKTAGKLVSGEELSGPSLSAHPAHTAVMPTDEPPLTMTHIYPEVHRTEEPELVIYRTAVPPALGGGQALEGAEMYTEDGEGAEQSGGGFNITVRGLGSEVSQDAHHLSPTTSRVEGKLKKK